MAFSAFARREGRKTGTINRQKTTRRRFINKSVEGRVREGAITMHGEQNSKKKSFFETYCTVMQFVLYKVIVMRLLVYFTA